MHFTFHQNTEFSVLRKGANKLDQTGQKFHLGNLYVASHCAMWYQKAFLISKDVMCHSTGCVTESGDLATVFFPGLVGVRRIPLLPPSSLLESVLVAMEPWTGAQRAFAVKAFYRNGYSFVITQPICPCHQDLGSEL
jgi:hypothetical protein